MLMPLSFVWVPGFGMWVGGGGGVVWIYILKVVLSVCMGAWVVGILLLASLCYLQGGSTEKNASSLSGARSVPCAEIGMGGWRVVGGHI